MTKRWKWMVPLAAFLIAFIYFALQVRSLDAYGGCRTMENFSLCVDGFLEPGKVGFKRLMTDHELIDRFQKHRGEFDEMAEFSLNQHGGDPDLPPGIWERRLGIIWIQRSSSGLEFPSMTEEQICIKSPPAGVSVSECIERKRIWRRLQFAADVTRTTDRKYWPHSNLVKYFLFYPVKPVFESGRVQYKGNSVLQLHPDLDRNWPPGWPTNVDGPHCLLRQIDTHWFLQLCKNDIGG